MTEQDSNPVTVTDDFLPKGWVSTTINELYSIIGGGTPSTEIEEYWQGDIPWISSADIFGLKDIRPHRFITQKAVESSATNIAPAKSLIVVTRVGLGKLAQAQFPLCFSQDSQALVDDTGQLCPEYILHYLSQVVQRFKYQSRGTTIAGVTKKQLAQVPVPLPPVAEQIRIVSKIEELFTQLDAGVAALKRLQANLRRYKASVLKAACEGRLVPQDPNDEPASVLLQHILAERRAKWEADLRAKGKDPNKAKYDEPTAPDAEGLPQLPKGWVWATWEQIGFSQNGRSFPSDQYQSEGIKLLRPGNLYADSTVQWTQENTRYLPEKWADEYPEFIVSGGELVMNLTAQSLKDEFLGRICLTSEGERCLLNQRLARLTPILVSRPYLLSILKSRMFRRFVDGLNQGSLIQHMFTSQLAKVCLPIPPLREQQRIADEVESISSILKSLEGVVALEIHRAERLRQSILKQAFEGKLVPQDPSDEPASALLDGIRAERAQSEKQPRQPRKANTTNEQQRLL